MNLQFRPALVGDIPAICRLVDAAYGPQVRRLFGDSARGRWAHYDEGKVRSYLDRHPTGVRIGIWQGKVVATCVSRHYGSLGWFHSLAVHPDFQRQKCGVQTVQDAESYLRGQGVACIGLMTWPDAVNNIGFYQRLGYRSVGLSVYAYRSTHTPVATGKMQARAVLLSTLEPEMRAMAFEACRRLSDRVLPGLDYMSWLVWALERRVGDVMCVWQERDLIAFALSFDRSSSDYHEGKLLVVEPQAGPGDVLWVMEHVRRWAAERRCSSFGFPADMMQTDTVEVFRQCGFRLYGDSMLNMVVGGPWPPNGIHLVRFSG